MQLVSFSSCIYGFELLVPFPCIDFFFLYLIPSNDPVFL